MKRLLEEGPCGGPSSPEQSNRRSIPRGTSNEGDGTDQESVGGELGTSRSMRTGRTSVCWPASSVQKPCGKDVMKPSWRRRNCGAARTSQYSVSIL